MTAHLDPIHVGFFAVPQRCFASIQEKHRAWEHSSEEMHDDTWVLGNDLFRAARDCAVAQRVLHEEKVWTVRNAVLGYLLRRAWTDRDQGLFSPEQAAALAEAFGKLERRVGEAKLVRGMEHKAGKSPPGLALMIYRALKETLDAAVKHQAGFLWAVLDEEAEERLAERQAEEAARNARRAERVARLEAMSPEARRAELAASKAEFDRWVESNDLYWERYRAENDAYDRKGNVTARIHSIEPRYFSRARARLARSTAAPVDTADWEPRVGPRAMSGVDLGTTGGAGCLDLDARTEVSSLAVLEELAAAACGPAYREDGVYDLEAITLLHQALQRWESDVGLDAIIDQVAEKAFGHKRSRAEFVCKRFFQSAEWGANRGRCVIRVYLRKNPGTGPG